MSSGKISMKIGDKLKPTIKNVKSIPLWTVLEVHWSDITEDPTGDPTKAHMVKRRSLGRMYSFGRDEGIPVLVLTLTRDADNDSQSGWFCIPLAVIHSLEIIKFEEDSDESDS